MLAMHVGSDGPSTTPRGIHAMLVLERWGGRSSRRIPQMVTPCCLLTYSCAPSPPAGDAHVGTEGRGSPLPELHVRPRATEHEKAGWCTEAEEQDELSILWVKEFAPARPVEGLSSRGVEEAVWVFDSCCPGFPYALQQPRLQEEVFQRGFLSKEES